MGTHYAEQPGTLRTSQHSTSVNDYPVDYDTDLDTDAPEGMVTEYRVQVTKEDVQGGYLDHIETRADEIRFEFELDSGFAGILQLTNNLSVSNGVTEAIQQHPGSGRTYRTSLGPDGYDLASVPVVTGKISLTLAQVQQIDPEVLDSGTLTVMAVSPEDIPSSNTQGEASLI